MVFFMEFNKVAAGCGDKNEEKLTVLCMLDGALIGLEKDLDVLRSSGVRQRRYGRKDNKALLYNFDLLQTLSDLAQNGVSVIIVDNVDRSHGKEMTHQEKQNLNKKNLKNMRELANKEDYNIRISSFKVVTAEQLSKMKEQNGAERKFTYAFCADPETPVNADVAVIVSQDLKSREFIYKASFADPVKFLRRISGVDPYKPPIIPPSLR